MTIEIKDDTFTGLADDDIAILKKPEVLEKISSLIELAAVPHKNKSKELLTEHAELKKALNELGGLDTFKQLKDAADATEKAKQDAIMKGNDAEAIRLEAKNQLESKDKELESIRQLMINDKVTAQLTKEIAAAHGDTSLLEPHALRRIKAELINGSIVMKVLDTEGNIMTTKGMKEAGLKELVEDLKITYPRAFDANNVSGSGAKNNTATGTENPWNPATRDLVRQNQIARENPVMAKQMAAAYGLNLPI